LSQELSYSDMVKQAAAEAVDPESEAVGFEEQVDASAPLESEGGSTEGTEAQSAAESERRKGFEDYLRDQGYDVDDVDPDSLYAEAVRRIQEASEYERQLAQLKSQLESRPAPQQPMQYAQPQQAQEPDAPVGNETQSEAIARKFAPLKAPDPMRYQMVDYDHATKTATPRPEFGAEALTAAQEITHYEREKIRRANLLVEDPLQVFGDDIKEMIHREAETVAERRFREWQEQQQQYVQQYQYEQAQRQYQQRIDDFYAQHKDKLFVLDGNGVPRRILNTNNYSMTVTGQRFHQEYAALRQRLPQVDDVTIMEIAIEKAASHLPPQDTPEQKREKFVATARKQEVRVPSQSTNAASVETQAQFNRPMRFVDMVVNDPENIDLPEIAELRSKR
jgi:predicted SpoU family rRNA methylase